jgi:glycine/D-amino acid oxidase-like deaminating enzyme
MTNIVKVDVAVVGGGIAGLWLLNRLRQKGYSALLIEKTALGSHQTVASQGMIHGGLKYALGGKLSGESEAIKKMPQLWQDCLQGGGELDLRDTRKLSDDFYLWSAGGLGAKMVSFFASRALRGRVESVPPEDYPSAFKDAPYKGKIYRLVDVVLDTPSLIDNLSAPHRPFIIKEEQLRWQLQDGAVAAVHCSNGLEIQAQRYVITAGEGSGEIMQALDISAPAMQLRPLHQAMVKHHLPHELYGHCIGAQTSASPRLTVSTHPCEDGKKVWYLGGDLATEGVDLTSDQLIDRSRQELDAIFPWLDFSGAEWATLYINRAEPLQDKLIKPDKAFASPAANHNNVIMAWPTKLSLAPDLAAQVIDLLPATVSTTPGTGLNLLDPLPKPAIAKPAWEELF